MSEYKPLNYTPGPWTVGGSLLASPKRTVARILRNTPEHRQFARGTCDHDMEAPTTAEECDSNARLIAAAPDLYEALTLAVVTLRRLDKVGSAVGTLDLARAALAKAEGGAL